MSNEGAQVKIVLDQSSSASLHHPGTSYHVLTGTQPTLDGREVEFDHTEGHLLHKSSTFRCISKQASKYLPDVQKSIS